jgi:hypothetical protein
MTQHINLLPRTRVAANAGPGLRPVAIAAAVALALSLAAGAWVTPQVGTLRAKAAELRKQQQALDAAAGKATALDAGLAAELAQARSRATQLGEAAARLREIDAVPAERFSDYFAALSRQTLPGVWLTGFSAEASTRRLAIGGRALSAELVPAWLKQLTREPALQDRRFAALDLAERPLSMAGAASAGGDGGTSVVEFRLQSAGRDVQPTGADVSRRVP